MKLSLEDCLKRNDVPADVKEAIKKELSERKFTEAALRDSEAKYREIVENSLQGIIIAQDDRIVFANQYISDLTGYTKEEVETWSSENWYKYIHPEDRPFVLKKQQEFLDGKSMSSHYQVRGFRKDGTISWVELYTSFIKYQGRRATQLVFIDITDRKRTEEELLFKNTLLEAQSETSIEGILLVNDEGKSILTNKRFGEMWNIPEEILETRNDEKMLQCILKQLKDPEKFLKKVNYLYDQKNWRSRDEIEFKDGKVFDRYSAPLMDSEDHYYGRIWYFRDITERKRTEEDLRRASTVVEKLNESLRVINSILRHDILNDLMVIRGTLELFQHEKDENHLEEAYKIMDKSVDLITRMRELEYLVFRDEGLKPHSLRQVVELVLKNYETHAIEFNVKGQAVVLADHALNSLIDNVIRNALTHSGTERIDIDITQQKDFCELRVTDYGSGIPDKIKSKIFEPGFKYGPTGQTGLGLYIAQKIVERYDGEIWVEDNNPRGSNFVLKLRRA
ncbi:MAG: PAS domain S-box protein [Promethearchaeota archaeon]